MGGTRQCATTFVSLPSLYQLRTERSPSQQDANHELTPGSDLGWKVASSLCRGRATIRVLRGRGAHPPGPSPNAARAQTGSKPDPVAADPQRHVAHVAWSERNRRSACPRSSTASSRPASSSEHRDPIDRRGYHVNICLCRSEWNACVVPRRGLDIAHSLVGGSPCREPPPDVRGGEGVGIASRHGCRPRCKSWPSESFRGTSTCQTAIRSVRSRRSSLRRKGRCRG